MVIFPRRNLVVGFARTAESGPGFRRPDGCRAVRRPNRSRVATIVAFPSPAISNGKEASGNALLSARLAGVPKDSVANVSAAGSLRVQFGAANS